jgi:AcrR family transcriptional regulator
MTRSKRSTVLENATALFIEHGFNAVGIEAVINASGVARMTMYRNFSSKDALVEAVLRERSAGLLAELGKQVLAKRTTMTRIRAIFDWHEDWYQSESFHGCLFERALTEFPLQADIRAAALSYKASLHEVMRNIFVAEYSTSTAKHLAMTAAVLIEGSTSIAHARPNDHVPNLAWQNMATIINAHNV